MDPTVDMGGYTLGLANISYAIYPLLYSRGYSFVGDYVNLLGWLDRFPELFFVVKRECGFARLNWETHKELYNHCSYSVSVFNLRLLRDNLGDTDLSSLEKICVSFARSLSINKFSRNNN